MSGWMCSCGQGQEHEELGECIKWRKARILILESLLREWLDCPASIQLAGYSERQVSDALRQATEREVER